MAVSSASHTISVVAEYLVYCVMQAIREGSVVSHIEGVCVGDHVEKINDVSVVGSRHFDVAKSLKEIPIGSTFSLRLVEPLKSGFCELGFCFMMTIRVVIVIMKVDAHGLHAMLCNKVPGKHARHHGTE